MNLADPISIKNEYDQEIPQSHNTDQPIAS